MPGRNQKRDLEVAPRTSTNTILEFQTSDVSRTLALDVVLDREYNSLDEMDILRVNAKPLCTSLVLVLKSQVSCVLIKGPSDLSTSTRSSTRTTFQF